MRYFIILSYNGTPFHGWQKQANDRLTIQYQIDHCLQTLLRNPEIESVGCGRTDAGVHAIDYVAHFDHDNNFDIGDILYHANKMLCGEIVIHKIIAVHENAHARYDAYSRTYTYSIKLEKDPFDAFSTYYSFGNYKCDVAFLQHLARSIIGKKDFSSFCKTNSSVKNNICTVYDAYWKNDGKRLIFYITANRFLRGMIRLLVGAMLNVHRGKLATDQWQKALDNEEPLSLPWSAPAEGLCLRNILYTYIDEKSGEYNECFLV